MTQDPFAHKSTLKRSGDLNRMHHRDKMHITVYVHFTFVLSTKIIRHLERIPVSDDDQGKTGHSMEKPWLRFYPG